MLTRKWISRELNNWSDWVEIKDGIREMQPKVAAFDTETTGLHIILDTPFLFQFGFLHPTDKSKGFTFLVDFRTNDDAKRIIVDWHEIVKECDVYLGHNIKFDLHMLKNVGLGYNYPNVSDTQFYIRYACDALHTSEGGPPLKLKDFSARYIDVNAKYHEKLLARERTEIAKVYNQKLKDRLSVLGAPPKPFTQKSYTLQVIQEMFKDPIFSEEDLPKKVRDIYLKWKEEDLPIYLQNKVTSLVESDMIRYSDLDPVNLHKYAHLDIIYTLEIYEKLNPILLARKNEHAVKIENSNIYPILDMERAGLLVDKDYLESCRVRMKKYIQQRRLHFKELAEQDIKIGQHAKIKEILLKKYGISLTSTGSTKLDLLHIDNEEAKGFIDTIQELRSLEKWYSTYIIKFKKELEQTDRIYTQINQVGTVSGRVSCDFQQFPKEPIMDVDGNELFHPRRMILCPPNCKYLAFIDYAAEELRFTAIYTVLVGSPDVNLLRAYMPYQCDPETWEPTDLHSLTTINAGFSKDDPNFKHYRKTIGKRLNFACAYGASYSKVCEMFPDKSPEECRKIYDAYYKSYPGIKAYHQYCFNRAKSYPYTSNLFGVKYYNINGHKLRNVLVQGSCAHFLKERIVDLYKFIKENNLKSRIVLSIHDELCFEIVKGEEWVIPKFKKIMEYFPDSPVPIVAEVEATSTNWAEKGEINE